MFSPTLLVRTLFNAAEHKIQALNRVCLVQVYGFQRACFFCICSHKVFCRSSKVARIITQCTGGTGELLLCISHLCVIFLKYHADIVKDG